MHYRPRRSRYTNEQWEVERDRFQIPSDEPKPVTDDHTSTLKEPIRKLIDSLGLKTDTIQQRLMNQWAQITGSPLCRHIRPGPLDRGTLIVYVSNSVMLSELKRFQGATLLKNIQAAVGANEIRKLVFLLDPDTRSQR